MKEGQHGWIQEVPGKARRADNGQFVPLSYARKHPKTTVVETTRKGTRKGK